MFRHPRLRPAVLLAGVALGLASSASGSADYAVQSERYVMFGMEDPVAGGSELTMVVVEHPALAATLKGAFETIWAQGLSFDEAYKRFAEKPAAPTPLRGRSK